MLIKKNFIIINLKTNKIVHLDINKKIKYPKTETPNNKINIDPIKQHNLIL